MSRYSEGEWDTDYNNAPELWEANYQRALRGRRGKKALAELREALLALPEHRLIAGALCTVNPTKRYSEPEPDDRRSWADRELDEVIEHDGEGVCAVGALLWYRKVKAGADPSEAFESLPTIVGAEDDGLDATARLAVSDAGLAYSLAWQIAYFNDEALDNNTPRARWQNVLVWVDSQLALPPLTAPSQKVR